jgi:hypothetical protein
MPERINGGLALAAIGAIVLFVSLFLDWFEPSRTAWTVFEINDLVLAALALLTIAIAASSIFAPTRAAYAPEGTIPWAGVGALIIVVATLIQHPPTALHDSPQTGAWLALAGAALITVGGLLLRARVSIVVTLRPRPPERTSSVRVSGRPEGTMPSRPIDEPEFEPDETETRPLGGEPG